MLSCCGKTRRRIIYWWSMINWFCKFYEVDRFRHLTTNSSLGMFPTHRAADVIFRLHTCQCLILSFVRSFLSFSVAKEIICKISAWLRIRRNNSYKNLIWVHIFLVKPVLDFYGNDTALESGLQSCRKVKKFRNGNLINCRRRSRNKQQLTRTELVEE